MQENLSSFIQPAGEITVLGTIFNVRAYDTDSCFTATLVEGSIRFETSSQSVLLSPDQQLTLNKNSAKIEVKAVNADVYTGLERWLIEISFGIVKGITEADRSSI